VCFYNYKNVLIIKVYRKTKFCLFPKHLKYIKDTSELRKLLIIIKKIYICVILALLYFRCNL